MNQEPDDPIDVDQFISRQSPDVKCSARELVDLIRIQLEDADERVESESVIFSKQGKDISGLKIEKELFNLFVPQSSVATRYAKSIGNVIVEGDGMQFKRLEDLKRSELKKMVREQGDVDR